MLIEDPHGDGRRDLSNLLHTVLGIPFSELQGPQATAFPLPREDFPTTIEAATQHVGILFLPEATPGHRTTTASTIAAFDWSPEAQAVRDDEADTARISDKARRRMGADVSTGSLAFVDVTGFFWRLRANSHYYFRIEGTTTSSATTRAAQLAVMGPPSPVRLDYIGAIAISLTAGQWLRGKAYDETTAQPTTSIAGELPFWLAGGISTGAQGGPFGLRLRASAAATVAVKQGTIGLVSAVGP